MKLIRRTVTRVLNAARRIPVQHRAALYRVTAAVLPFAVAAGYVSDGTAQTILTVLAFLLGTTGAVVAAANTPRDLRRPVKVVTRYHPAD